MSRILSYGFLLCVIMAAILLCLLTCDDELMPVCLLKQKKQAKVYVINEIQCGKTCVNCITIFQINNNIKELCTDDSQECKYTINDTKNIYTEENGICTTKSIEKLKAIIVIALIILSVFTILIVLVYELTLIIKKIQQTNTQLNISIVYPNDKYIKKMKKHCNRILM